MLKKYKSENGITLIALVVTIIVLIILAGVSINLVLGDNGIITKAKEAAVGTRIESYKEQIDLLKLNLEIEKGSSLTIDDLIKEINEKEILKGGKIEKDDNVTAIVTTKEGDTFRARTI